nr:hypothetical protein [Mesorhizobium loti]
MQIQENGGSTGGGEAAFFAIEGNMIQCRFLTDELAAWQEIRMSSDRDLQVYLASPSSRLAAPVGRTRNYPLWLSGTLCLLISKNAAIIAAFLEDCKFTLKVIVYEDDQLRR